MIEKCEKCGHTAARCGICGRVVHGMGSDSTLNLYLGKVIVHQWFTCGIECKNEAFDVLNERLRGNGLLGASLDSLIYQADNEKEDKKERSNRV